MRIYGQCDLFCIRKRSEYGPRCKNCGRSRAELASARVYSWIGPTADDISSTIYRLVANGAFPRPVHLGPRAIAWRWTDLEQWSATRAADHH
ncbi:MAG: AlpA family phage regulatory protein [Betaproteobacteria bacterium]|nr:AlpA family phage regulatory protein [Betaproteobacteria bacterium]